MNKTLRTALALGCVAVAAQASAQVTFFEHDGFAGRAFSTQRPVEDFGRYGFNDRASSVQVDSGQWEVCEDAEFRGRCVVLRQGRYSSLGAMGLNDRISSVRAVVYPDYTPAPMSEYDAHRRPNERLYQARVVSTRAVVGPPEQRCW
ncbi:MAG: beta/gamma crystallin family protein, partial [Burkholderiales bacterium]|nr:beta/gamma crystallin family protein [Burkholderiales bacterium]